MFIVFTLPPFFFPACFVHFFNKLLTRKQQIQEQYTHELPEALDRHDSD